MSVDKLGKTDDERIDQVVTLPPPEHLIRFFPISGSAIEDLVASTRQNVRNILSGQDDRLLVVIGPCSIHDPRSALEYAQRLVALREKHAQHLEIVMRVYFEKPRTTVGWKGLINDPNIDGSFDINLGLRKARHLLKYHYSNPHWEKKRSQVVALEQATLYGLVIHADKKVSYGRINPSEAKEIFIRSALIQGDFECRAKFFLHNQRLLEELEALEAKSRRRDIIVDENVLYDFYEQQLPDEINNGAALDKWLRNNPGKEKTLFLTTDDLMRKDATLVSASMFPDHLEMNGSRFPIEYHFDPRNHCDGITLITPVAGLNAVNPQRCEWLIPGLLHEKIVAMIKSLPKQLRKNFVPAPTQSAAPI